MTPKAKKTVRRPVVGKNNLKNFWSGIIVIIIALILWPLMCKMFCNNLLNLSTFGCRLAASTSWPLDETSGADHLSTGTFVVPEEQIGFDALTFLSAPDGQSLAYVSRGINQEQVALNGKLGPVYDKITFMMFSPDGRHFAYGAKQDGKELIVLDGEPGKLYDWTLPPRFFTPDSRYFVYKTRIEAGDILVFNTGESRAYDMVYSPFVSTDGKELVYFGRVGNQFWRQTLPLEQKAVSAYENLGD